MGVGATVGAVVVVAGGVGVSVVVDAGGAPSPALEQATSVAVTQARTSSLATVDRLVDAFDDGWVHGACGLTGPTGHRASALAAGWLVLLAGNA